ncbi:oxidoreductase [Streptomyces tanashiensis]|uniref:aldo/keto reductase n=1 Tax=Streptomyces tanashiensis TaxID=67367 RepID=UPI00167471C5|nr:aldo/keto reductase [Streptomyces tanashiensis]GGT26294.1 oxidoreductase [Streptomyces tanashiensis]
MTLRQNVLGRGQVKVSELAFGAAVIGNLFNPVTDAQAEEAVMAAWECGVRHFDTAPHYGLGLSERRLGAVLRGMPREEFTISTKVGRLLEPADPGSGGGDDLADGGFAVPATHRRRWDFTAEGVRRSLASSMERLGLDRIDVAYLHDPDDHAEWALTEAYPELERLRAEGVLGAIGVGMNQAELPARFIRETDIDAVLLAGRYSLLDHSGLTELLPLAAERGVGIVIGGVFNSGLLADPRPGATFDYTTAPSDLVQRALDIKAVCESHDVPLRAAALRFPFGHPAIASVLVGTRSADQVRDSAAMLQHHIPAALWADLKERGLLPPDVPTPEEVN